MVSYVMANTPLQPVDKPTFPGTARGGRLLSLDALRGVTVAVMLLVNSPGSWTFMYPALAHARWDGCTLADLVFPFFLFAVGASLQLSTHRAFLAGASPAALFRKAVIRGVVLILLGLALNALPILLGLAFGNGGDWATLRPLGVLQRIGIVSILAAGVVLFTRRWQQLLLAVIIIVWYTWLLGPAPIHPTRNIAASVDGWILPASHLYRGGPLDPEGFLSTLPALLSSLLGAWVAGWLQQQPREVATARRLLCWGGLLCLGGMLLSTRLPVNKVLWTPAYVLLTAGLATWVWSLFYYMAEVRQRSTSLKVWIIFGSNAIFAFVASGLVGRLLGFIRWGSPPTTFTSWAFGWLSSLFAPNLASLMYALASVVVWFALHLALYRRGIFFKV